MANLALHLDKHFPAGLIIMKQGFSHLFLIEAFHDGLEQRGNSLQAAGDSRSTAVLAQGHALLNERLAGIAGEADRQAVAGNIRAHAEMLKAIER